MSSHFQCHSLFCEQCGHQFWATRYDAKYCSGPCRSRAHRDSAKRARLRVKINDLMIDYLNMFQDDVEAYENAIDELIRMATHHTTIDRKTEDGVK